MRRRSGFTKAYAAPKLAPTMTLVEKSTILVKTPSEEIKAA